MIDDPKPYCPYCNISRADGLMYLSCIGDWMSEEERAEALKLHEQKVREWKMRQENL